MEISKIFKIRPFIGEFQSDKNDEGFFLVKTFINGDKTHEVLESLVTKSVSLMRKRPPALEELEMNALDAACKNGFYVTSAMNKETLHFTQAEMQQHDVIQSKDNENSKETPIIISNDEINRRGRSYLIIHFIMAY
jgi:hypothetical protein